MRRTERHRVHVYQGDIQGPQVYPWMSYPDAIVHLELERRHVAFTYRYFKPEWSLQLQQTIGDPPYAPEFTLPDYRIVIMVIGTFWGQIPGIIDRQSLAKVILESEGWKVVVWNEVDIRQAGGVVALINRDLPQLNHPTRHGNLIPTPGGLPNYIARLQKLVAQHRKLIIKTRETKVRERAGRPNRRYRRRRNRVRSNSG